MWKEMMQVLSPERSAELQRRYIQDVACERFESEGIKQVCEKVTGYAYDALFALLSTAMQWGSAPAPIAREPRIPILANYEAFQKPVGVYVGFRQEPNWSGFGAQELLPQKVEELPRMIESGEVYGQQRQAGQTVEGAE